MFWLEMKGRVEWS